MSEPEPELDPYCDSPMSLGDFLRDDLNQADGVCLIGAFAEAGVSLYTGETMLFVYHGDGDQIAFVRSSRGKVFFPAFGPTFQTIERCLAGLFDVEGMRLVRHPERFGGGAYLWDIVRES
jgi:hypothetical protein